MIQYGAHSYIFTERWSDDSLPVLDTAKSLGLDCLEIAVGDDVRFTAELTRRHAEGLAMKLIISPGGYWPLEYDLSSEDAGEREKGLDWHKRQVDLANAVGAAVYCGALYGHPGVMKRRPPLPEEYRWIADGLHHLSEYASAKGVAVVVEPMSHFRTNLVNQPEQAMELISLADHPNLSVLLDTYHMITEVRDYGQAIRTVGSDLWGLHACENDRGAPGGGLVPWQAVFSALKEIGFAGTINLEAYNSSIPGFAWQRGMFHNVCPDANTFVRQSLAFLQQGLG